MSNRILRDGFLDSEKINAIDSEAQLFFVRLLLVVDDFGRFDARLELLSSKCFPVCRQSAAKCGQLLQRNVDAGLVVLYEVDGKKYLFIPDFNQRLRRMRSRFPEPHKELIINTIQEPVSNPPQSAADCGLNLNPNLNQKQKQKQKRKRDALVNFPTLEMVKEYCTERKNNVDPEKWIDHYTSNGWKVGKNPMQDWKAAVRTWEKNGFDDGAVDDSWNKRMGI